MTICDDWPIIALRQGSSERRAAPAPGDQPRDIFKVIAIDQRIIGSCRHGVSHGGQIGVTHFTGPFEDRLITSLFGVAIHQDFAHTRLARCRRNT